MVAVERHLNSIVEHLTLDPIQRSPRFGYAYYTDEQRRRLLQKLTTYRSIRVVRAIEVTMASGEILEDLESEQYARVLAESDAIFFYLSPKPPGPVAYYDTEEAAIEADAIYLLHKVSVAAHYLARGMLPVWP